MKFYKLLTSGSWDRVILQSMKIYFKTALIAEKPTSKRTLNWHYACFWGQKLNMFIAVKVLQSTLTHLLMIRIIVLDIVFFDQIHYLYFGTQWYWCLLVHIQEYFRVEKAYQRIIYSRNKRSKTRYMLLSSIQSTKKPLVTSPKCHTKDCLQNVIFGQKTVSDTTTHK